MSPVLHPVCATVLAAAAILFCGCNRSTPVSSLPLQGSIGGKSFTAKAAFVSAEEVEAMGKGLHELRIVDAAAPAGCSTLLDSGKNYAVIHGWIPWASGFTQKGPGKNGEAHVFIFPAASSGEGQASDAIKRIEIVSISPTDSVLRLRLADAKSSVEGEVHVQVCNARHWNG